MISFSSIGSAGGAARYHDKSFSQDGVARADNYYLDEKSAASWGGKGAELLEWGDQPVTREQFIDALEGRLHNPATGDIQDLSTNSRERRAGIDLTIAPAKSVSILALVGHDARVVEAHRSANAAAMGWLEQHASTVRVRENGGPPEIKLQGNLLYTTVVHETDRSNGPQLHSHNVVAAVVYDHGAGKWRSLTNDTVLNLRAKADIVYKAQLAHGLRAAGYQLEYDKNGVDFEIKGVSEQHIAAYAKRSEQIKEALTAHGIDPGGASYEARQAATLDSRAAKQDVPRAMLQSEWQATAREIGLDVGGLVGAARERAATLDPVSLAREDRAAALKAVSWAVEHFSEREQVFKVVDLQLAALTFSRRVTEGQVTAAIAEMRDNGHLVDRGTTNQGAQILTTPKALAMEQSLIGDIRAGRREKNVILSEGVAFDSAAQAFEARKTTETGASWRLSTEQRDAARNVLMHPDSFQGIQGEAGTGKTAALAMVRDVAETQGWQVIGMATSSSAARTLQDDSGIKSQTVASFLVDRDNAIRLAKKEIRELEAGLASRHAPPASEPLRAERQKLTVEAGETRFGTSHYVFDHKKGEVFRSATSFTGLVGNFLMDSADTVRERAVKSRSLGGHIKADALDRGASLADALGQKLARFDKVGMAEAAMARSTLYLSRAPETDAIERSLALKAAQLANLERKGNVEGRKTLLVMDEASLTGTADTARISALARSIGARVVFQGDVKQHGSVPAGRAFWQAQEAGMHTSVLEETRRFKNATEQVKGALQDMKRGEFGAALGRLDTTEVEPGKFAEAVAERYVASVDELKARGIESPTVGIVALTNKDRKEVNTAVHDALVAKGSVAAQGFDKVHLDDPKLSAAERTNVGRLQAAGVDRLVFRQRYRELGVEKLDVARVTGFDAERNRIQIEAPSGRRVWFDPVKQERFSPARLESRIFSTGDQIEARANLRFERDGAEQVKNGSRGVITQIDDRTSNVRWSDGRETALTNDHLRFVDHGYARTSFKEQGATNQREILAVSNVGANVINKEATYVAATRAKDNTEIVTSARERMIENAGRDVSKATALEGGLPTPTLGEAIATRREAIAHISAAGAAAREPALTLGQAIDLHRENMARAQPTPEQRPAPERLPQQDLGRSL